MHNIHPDTVSIMIAFPENQVMRKRECAYCRKSLIDSGGCKEVSHLFGIQACTDHIDLATRDVNAYMHRRRVVRVADTRYHPKLKPLFNILRSGVSLKRSSGLIDPGWKLRDDFYNRPNLIEKHGNMWLCEFYKPISAGVIDKSASLATIFDDVPDVPPTHLEHLATALEAMEKGIYVV